jgi:hypothetical protein
MATTITLSTLDKSAPCAYIRYALAFACSALQDTIATDALHKASKKLINEIPMLAGTVTINDDSNPTVTVTLQQVDAFQPTITYLSSAFHNYDTLRRHGITPSSISKTQTAPSVNNTNPCCVIQANFLEGGLIVVINLHHAVADIHGVSTIMCVMTEGLPLRELNEESLEQEAATVSEARASLSSRPGLSAFLPQAPAIDDKSPKSAVVLHFRLSNVLETTEIANFRRSWRDPNLTDKISPREVLIAIIWRAYVRARWPRSAPTGNVSTTMSFPINLRVDVIPTLDAHWMGNAETTVVATENPLYLGLAYDPSYIERTAAIVHAAVALDLEARKSGQSSELVVHDWTHVPVDMDLGLGLGRPDAVRRIGSGFGSNEVVLLPANPGADKWEVQIEWQREWVLAVLRDEGLKKYLLIVDR